MSKVVRCQFKQSCSNIVVFLPVKTHIANTVDMHLHWPFLKQDWKEKAQKHREDLDMGVLEDMKCPTCNTVFKRMKDFKYHIKDCQRNVNVTFLDVGNNKKKLERHKNKFHLQCFKCEVCSKVFAEKRNLKRHKCTHK